jgi:hypothetical protein
MGTARFSFLIACVVLCRALWSEPVEAAQMDFSKTFTSGDEIKAWAAKSFFGGASTSPFARGSLELVAVVGMPTSGLVTSQLLVFGRATRAENYRLLVSSTVLEAMAKVRGDADGVTFVSGDRTLLIVPFEIALKDRPSGHPGRTAEDPK